ncbi:Cytochrome b-c1 complex subunit 2, mitochondrial [Smittium culicis]|uniref:Cytochrome b-c1 complex subunit 2, mitochondrial n=1 Tax=Smittium culicis TaxID=133412 RepID=A0A1R1XUB1_9FUNG|nr:Cytochrome b-c1 complex subunit 2, mitochondrial [Smittium culicis]
MYRLSNLSNLKQSIKSRGFASVAANASKNGIKVVGVESQKATELGSISVVLNLGSRFETADQIGAAHYLKAFGFRNSKERTSFRKVREAELQGAMLSSELTRENVIYTVKCMKQDIPYFFQMMSEMTNRTLFNSWEFDEINNLVGLESGIAATNPITVLSEKLHHAIYRTGLGNSLYAGSSSSISGSEAVKNYMHTRFNANNVAIIGRGISSEQLAELVNNSEFAELSSGAPQTAAKSKFHSGSEVHTSINSEYSHYALAFEAPDAATARLLSEYLGSASTPIKYSAGVSPLAQIAREFNSSSISSFSQSYSDSSLVGILVSAPSAQLHSVLSAVMKQVQALASSPVSAESFSRAVACARMQHLSNDIESFSGLNSFLANGVFSSGANALGLVSQQLETASLPSFQSAIKSTFASKPVAASVGNSMLTPYLDSI